MTDEPKERELDPRHMALRAACFRLRQLAHGIMAQGGTKGVRSVAEDFYDRLSAALYPTNDSIRQEPLQRLLDDARAGEAHEYHRLLEQLRDGLQNAVGEAPGELQAKLTNLVSMIDDFFRET